MQSVYHDPEYKEIVEELKAELERLRDNIGSRGGSSISMIFFNTGFNDE